jgi:hypothetical protein
MSHFGKSLTKQLRINQNLSSTFHSQMDGISERKNQWIEQYLQLVTSASPDDWTQWLAIATVVHNNQKNGMTSLSPNQILLGYELTLHSSKDTLSNNEVTKMWIKNMMEKRAQAIDAINGTAQGGQMIPSQYKLEEQVWLEVTHLRIHHQKTKLNPK